MNKSRVTKLVEGSQKMQRDEQVPEELQRFSKAYWAGYRQAFKDWRAGRVKPTPPLFCEVPRETGDK